MRPDTEPAAGVDLVGVGKTYDGAERPALADASLSIPPGAFFSILGPSGCGKTTLLRILAGFEYPTTGRVLIGGTDVTAMRPRDRGIAMVFQDYALYPHMTVERNITFNLSNKGVPKETIRERLATTAQILHIGHLLKKKPKNLSGGERQRVALGRALIRKPKVFLMDEPLSNLDLKLREAMRIELGRLHQDLGITVVYVTHDQSEAMTLSTDLAILKDGHIQQTGKPAAVYAAPDTTFVARFIGSPSMNLFRMRKRDGRLSAPGWGDLPAPAAAGVLPEDAPVLVGVRAHHLFATGPGTGGLPATVGFTEHLGRSNIVVCAPAGGDAFLHEQDAIQIETDGDVEHPPGTALALAAEPRSVHLFDPTTGVRIRPAEEDGGVALAGGRAGVPVDASKGAW